MKLPVRLWFLLTVISTFLGASDKKASDWGMLLDQGKVEQARTLCTKMTRSSEVPTKVEGLKCLANVELCGKSMVNLQGDDAGGGTLSSAYDPKAAQLAIGHLENGIQLAPQDLSIHQGRLHILEVQGRFTDMAKALDESATLYKGDDPLQDWLPYIAELHDLGQFHAAIQLLVVLDRHYPNSNLVIGNFGAMYLSLKEEDRAIGYLKKAVELAPKDPIDNWNLARAYDFTGKNDLAAEGYLESIDLADAEQKKGMLCFYSEFVDKKLKDPARACQLQKDNCAAEKQTACASRATE